MVRSRSRSPRWKRRSLSPAAKNQEHNRQRHNLINYDSEYKVFRKDPKKPMSWRTEDGKHRQAISRYSPHETNHHRVYEHRPYSPAVKRIPSENMYSRKSYRAHSPEKNENNRGCQFNSRYSEMTHKEHDQPFYPSEVHAREMHEDNRPVGIAKGMKPFHRPLETSSNFQKRKWNDTDLRNHQIQEEKYTHSPRRYANQFMPRSSFEKRYHEDRDDREYGHMYKRAKEVERYDDREMASNSKWKHNYSSKPNHEKGEQRNLGLQTHHPVEKEYSDSCQTKLVFDYNYKHHRHPDGGKYISGERAEKYMKLEDPKYYPKGSWNSKYSDHYSGEKESHTEELQTETAVKYNSGKLCNSSPKSYKSDAVQKEKERIKKHDGFRERVDISSSHQHDTNNKISDMKVLDIYTKKEKLTVKVDMKKTVNKYRGASSHVMERQTSRDLVAVGRTAGNFHSVFEHIKSVPQRVEQNPSKEFAREIITIIHQIKANYFKSSNVTLHERFSKIQAKPIASEIKRHSDPEIHRRINMSLADLQSKRAISCESGQSVVKVLEDPNDLRHDIERRRKERLKNKDDRSFYADDVSKRHEQRCSFPNLQNFQMHGNQKYSRFLNPPFGKYIKKPYTPNFSDGRLPFRSNLVQKGLYIQAKYQRLRYVGTRGFTTNKMGRGFLRK